MNNAYAEYIYGIFEAAYGAYPLQHIVTALIIMHPRALDTITLKEHSQNEVNKRFYAALSHLKNTTRITLTPIHIRNSGCDIHALKT